MKIVSESNKTEQVVCKHCGRLFEITSGDLRYECSKIMGNVVYEGYYFFCISCRGLNKLDKKDPIVRHLKG